MNKDLVIFQDESWELMEKVAYELSRAYSLWKGNFAEIALINNNGSMFDEYVDELLDMHPVLLDPLNQTHLKQLENTIDKINDALSFHEPRYLVSLFNQAQQHCDALGIEFEFDAEIIDEAITFTKIKEGSLLFIPPKPKLLVPQLIIPTQSYFISLIKNKPDFIFNITPRQFEEIIAELFHNFGFDVELTKPTRDGGRDIIAINEIHDIQNKYLIECKRYAPANKISVSIVQRLYGIKVSEAATKAILVTTSSYTSDARKFASKHIWELDLKAYDDVINWIKNYKYRPRLLL